MGADKAPECVGFTITQWSSTAHELVLLNLLQDFELTGKPALLDPRTIKVGMSFKAHTKVQNVIQIIYVKQKSNQIA